MSEQGNYNVLVEVKKTTIWLRKKDAEKPIDGRIKNQGVIMIENKIILIEDDKEIRGMINDYLSGEFEVTAFNDGMSAIQKITSYDEYALALIDLMLPDISGMEIIKIIRKVSKIPIIIITAKDNDIDKSLGLNLGADDYVVKPFSLIELTARIKANIRRARTYQALPNNSIIKIKDIEIDPHSHMVQRKGVLDEFDQVSIYLEEAIKKEIPAWCVKDWPLLNQYRESEQYALFVEKHKDLFDTNGYESANEAIGDSEDVISELGDDLEIKLDYAI